MIKAVVRWQRRTVRAMALHFPLYRGCDLSSHWWCRSLNKRITCQLLLRYMGTVQTSMVTISNLKHESSNLTHSGTDGEGSKKQKHKKKTLPGFPRPHLTYVGCPERAPPPGIRSLHDFRGLTYRSICGTRE